MNATKIKPGVKNRRKRETVHQSTMDGSSQMRGMSPTSGGPLSSFYSSGPVLSLNPIVQPKLTIGKPNDRYEREADRVADQVMRMPEGSLVQRESTCPECLEEKGTPIQAKPIADQVTPLVQRQVVPEEEEEKIEPGQAVQGQFIQKQEEEKEEEEPIPPVQEMAIQRQEEEEEKGEEPAPAMSLQRQEMEPEEEEKEPVNLQTKSNTGSSPKITPQIASGIRSLKGGGQPLPKSVRSYFEPRFGTDFSQVRVHTNYHAAETAKSINAKAFTTGKDVVFGAGQYSPGSLTGRRLMAHELTHVIQQDSKKGSTPETLQRTQLRSVQTLDTTHTVGSSSPNTFPQIAEYYYGYKLQYLKPRRQKEPWMRLVDHAFKDEDNKFKNSFQNAIIRGIWEGRIKCGTYRPSKEPDPSTQPGLPGLVIVKSSINPEDPRVKKCIRQRIRNLKRYPGLIKLPENTEVPIPGIEKLLGCGATKEHTYCKMFRGEYDPKNINKLKRLGPSEWYNPAFAMHWGAGTYGSLYGVKIRPNCFSHFLPHVEEYAINELGLDGAAGCPPAFARRVALIIKRNPSESRDTSKSGISGSTDFMESFFEQAKIVLSSPKILKVLCTDTMMPIGSYHGKQKVRHLVELSPSVIWKAGLKATAYGTRYYPIYISFTSKFHPGLVPMKSLINKSKCRTSSINRYRAIWCLSRSCLGSGKYGFDLLPSGYSRRFPWFFPVVIWKYWKYAKRKEFVEKWGDPYKIKKEWKNWSIQKKNDFLEWIKKKHPNKEKSIMNWIFSDEKNTPILINKSFSLIIQIYRFLREMLLQ